jgi:DNA-binding XRE family transcriptional regulator
MSMGVLEIIAQTHLGPKVLRRRSSLRKSLIHMESLARELKEGSRFAAQKKRISAIAELCIEYKRETDPVERGNILRTLEEITADASIEAPTETLDQFEARLQRENGEYRQASEQDSKSTREFLRKYFSLRARAGLSTQSDVARRSGLHRSYIAVIEKGGHKPQQKTLQKLAKAFGVEITELL